VIRFVADENLDNDILRGLRRRNPAIDIIRVQDVGLLGASDEAVLEFAALEDRILLTHDVSTVISIAADRVEQELPMPGVIAVIKHAAKDRSSPIYYSSMTPVRKTIGRERSITCRSDKYNEDHSFNETGR
jgi:hypothetical protein